ncbi:MAG: D-alanyl-D-alanine carboxypeptidase [Clostridia bacterium]|nr:D-alanyl-D-alanine carboxypeptidase [Clostridia bacterium]
MNQQIPTRQPSRSPQRSQPPRTPNQRQYVPRQKSVKIGLASTMIVVFVITLILLVISLVLLCVALAVDGEDKPAAIEPMGNAQQEEVSNTPTGSKKPLYSTVPSRSDYFIENSSSYQTVSGIDSEYTILLDLSSYEAVAGLNADTRICPASMTKIMTLLIACENITSLTEKVTVSAASVTYQANHGASGLAWTGGEVLSVEDLLYLIYFRSDTVACLTMAEYLAGSEANFVSMMNQKAEKLGLRDTYFTNSTGLKISGENYYTTCREMAMIMAYALDNPLAKKVMTQTGSWYLPESAPVEYVRPTWVTDRFAGNAVLDTVTIKAAKTGWEDEPGACLVSYAESGNGKQYINVIVGGNGLSATKSTADVKAIYKNYAK